MSLQSTYRAAPQWHQPDHQPVVTYENQIGMMLDHVRASVELRTTSSKKALQTSLLSKLNSALWPLDGGDKRCVGCQLHPEPEPESHKGSRQYVRTGMLGAQFDEGQTLSG